MKLFKEKASKIKNKAKKEELTILIWGPGDPGQTASSEQKLAYQKRLQIKEVLNKEFPFAEVCFSEDQEMNSLSDDIYGQLEKETLHAAVSDLIIVLDLSRGSDVELDYFVPKYSWFRDKMFVLLPKKYLNTTGLAKEIHNHLHPCRIVGFTEDELKNCTVTTQKAVAIALTAALMKFFNGFSLN